MNVLDTFKLDGKVALVTGSAGLFGRQIAGAARGGARTFVASRNLGALEEQAALLKKEGLEIFPLALDQADEASVLGAAGGDCEASGAGGYSGEQCGAAADGKLVEPGGGFAKSMAVNATGTFMMTRAFGEHMASNGGGSIINIGSIQGMVGPDYSLYEGLGWGSPADYFVHKGG